MTNFYQRSQSRPAIHPTIPIDHADQLGAAEYFFLDIVTPDLTAEIDLLSLRRSRSSAGSCTFLAPQPSCSVLIVPAKSEGRCEGEISITGVKKFFHAQRNWAEGQCMQGVARNDPGARQQGQCAWLAGRSASARLRTRCTRSDLPAPTRTRSRSRDLSSPTVKAHRQGVVCDCKKVRFTTMS